jgi:transmembrane sensor
MSMDPVLIRQFINNQCSAADAEKVAAYLQSHPEVLREYLSEEEWEATEPADLPAVISEHMLSNIEKKMRPVKRMYRYVAAAAATLVAVSLLSMYLFSGKQKEARPLAYTKQQPQLIKKVNNGTQPVEFILSDQSKITLAPGGTVSYPEPFTPMNREVHLSGKATFSVQASPEKPFVVYGGNVTTTALGTVFTVVAYNNNRHTEVKLTAGKVVIRPISGGMAVVLKPGEEMKYDNKLLTSSVSVTNKAKQVSAAKPAGVVMMRDSIFFYDAPLAEIVKALGNTSEKTIKLGRKHLPSISFTGQFDQRNDNAVSILQTIAGLNNLVVTETDSEIIIGK